MEVVLLSRPRLQTKFGASPALFGRARISQPTFWIRAAPSESDECVHRHGAGSYRLLTAPSGLDWSRALERASPEGTAGRRGQSQPATRTKEPVGNRLPDTALPPPEWVPQPMLQRLLREGGPSADRKPMVLPQPPQSSDANEVHARSVRAVVFLAVSFSARVHHVSVVSTTRADTLRRCHLCLRGTR
jgi:hypothetical protein